MEEKTGASRPSMAERNNSVLNDLITDIISSTEPSLRHLASHSTLKSSSHKVSREQRRLSTPVSEQRHPGKPGAHIHRTTRNLDEVLDWDNVTEPPHALDVVEEEEDDVKLDEIETVHPGPWSLAFLTTGICLSVFLISLDRTIITTVRILSPTACHPRSLIILS
jgi:hypothetical protein